MTTELSNEELLMIAMIATEVADGLLQVAAKCNIEVGSVTFESEDDKPFTAPARVIVDMCKYKLGLEAGTAEAVKVKEAA